MKISPPAPGQAAPQAHATSHTDGSDDIQSATNAQKGLATAAQITTLEDAILNGDVAAKGDVFVGTGAGAAAVVTIGNTGDVATVAGGTLSWAPPASSGETLAEWGKSQEGIISPSFSAATMSGDGLLTSVSHIDATSSTAHDADGQYFKQDTAATTGNDALTTGATQNTKFGSNQSWWYKFKTGADISACRIGFAVVDYSTTPYPFNSDDATGTDYVGIQFSTNRADANWQFVSCDAVAQEKTDLGAGSVVAVSTCYIVNVYTEDAGVTWECRLYNGAGTQIGTATHSTRVPTTTTTCRPNCGVETLENVAKSVYQYAIRVRDSGAA